MPTLTFSAGQRFAHKHARARAASLGRANGRAADSFLVCILVRGHKSTEKCRRRVDL